MWRLKSLAPSSHHGAPRSPSATFAWWTVFRAAARLAGSCCRRAAFTSRRALDSACTSALRSASDRFGLLARQRRPRTTMYRPSGVVSGCILRRGLGSFLDYFPVRVLLDDLAIVKLQKIMRIECCEDVFQRCNRDGYVHSRYSGVQLSPSNLVPIQAHLNTRPGRSCDVYAR